MANTTNLDMEIVPTSNFISPEPFNNNFKKLDKLGIDYVVESGTSGEWWYRKWKSGRAECGIDSKNFGNADLESWGAVYSTYKGWSFGAYPFSFSKTPFVAITPAPGSGYYGIILTSSSSPTTRSPEVDIWRATKTSISNVILGIYVCGAYK